MIATDVPGCRDVVIEGQTGFLCTARSAEALAAALEQMLRIEPAARAEMGRRARIRVERDFDEALVSSAYLDALEA
jgi:glycosyltransferase involved in cell wall biosynthesis